MTTKRKTVCTANDVHLVEKIAVLSLLHAARRHGSSGCVVQH